MVLAPICSEEVRYLAERLDALYKFLTLRNFADEKPKKLKRPFARGLFFILQKLIDQIHEVVIELKNF